VLKLYRAIIGIGLLLSILLVASCGDKSTNPKQVGDIWPLKVGNLWRAQVVEYDTNAVVISTDTLVLEVAKDTIIHNETFYIITVNGVRDPEVPPLTERSDGIYWYWSLPDTIALCLKYPAAVNDWFYWGNDSAVVVSTNISVTVPAGTFSCYQYDIYSSPSQLKQSSYYSPYYGPVKSEEYSKTQGGRLYVYLKMELISYVLH
jgi:hypothetical protein